MNLGQLIERLETLDPDLELDTWVGDPMSYRGYYDELAFDGGEGPVTVQEMLEKARSCIDCTFTGYKGGEFTMDESTPVWLAEYGRSGHRIANIDDTGTVHTTPHNLYY